MTAFLSALRKFKSYIFPTLATAAGLFIGFMAVYTFFTAPDSPEHWPHPKRFAKIEKDLAEGHKSLNNEIQSLKTDMSSLRSEIAELSKIPDNAKVAAQLEKLHNSVSDVSTRLGKLEAVILENPSKALEMPFLRKDIDNLKSRDDAELTSIKQEIGRVYDLMIGLMVTMALGILSLAITYFLKKGKTD